jgi:hypothetical protein
MYRLQDFKVQPGRNIFEDIVPGILRGSSIPASPVGAANAAPVVVPMPEPVVPQTPPAPANRASVSPILLGENPFEQAANQAVAQSLSGQ